MKKTRWIGAVLGMVAAGIGGCLAQTAPAQAADKPIVLRLAHINALTDPKHKEAEKFKELVEAKTHGKVKVEIYGAGVLGNIREIIEGLQLGTNEVVIEGFGTIPSYTKLALLDLVPFMYRDRTHFEHVWNGQIGKELLAEAGKQANMKLFGPSYRGVRVVTSTKRFTDVAGVKGLKMRVPADDMSVKTWQALGATPTPMAMTEVLTRPAAGHRRCPGESARPLLQLRPRRRLQVPDPHQPPLERGHVHDGQGLLRKAAGRRAGRPA